MRFPNIFGRKKEALTETYAEIPVEEEKAEHVKIMLDKLDSYGSTDRVLKKVRDGNIVIVKVKELRDQNLDELKQSISRMKTMIQGFDGDIAGVGDEWLIVTPRNAKVHRGIE